MNSIQIGQLELDIIEGVFGILGAVILGVAPALLTRLFAILAQHKIMLSTQLQANIANDLHAAIPRAITAAAHLTETDLVDANAKFTPSSPIVAEAANYLIAHKGDALNALGISPTQDSKALTDLILAHLPPPGSAPAPTTVVNVAAPPAAK